MAAPSPLRQAGQPGTPPPSPSEAASLALDAGLFLPLVDKYIAMAKEKHGYNIEQVRGSTPGPPAGIRTSGCPQAWRPIRGLWIPFAREPPVLWASGPLPVGSLGDGREGRGRPVEE